jgi:hypothetical protein
MFGISAFSEAPFSGLAEGSVTVFVTGVSATGQVGNVSVVIPQDATAFVFSFDSYDILSALIQAVFNNEPGKTLFADTTIGGRPLGDIDNTGSVTYADAFDYLDWYDLGTTGSSASDTYIETVMNAYMTQNPATYAAYISFAYGQTGSVSVSVTGNANVSLTGVAASGGVGFVVITGDANVPVTGVFATGQVGSVTIIEGQGVNVPVTGVEGTTALGNETVVAKATIQPSGVFGTGFIGSVVITADAVVVTTGVEATGQVGNANVLIVVPVIGVQGTITLGTITLESNNYLDVTGFGMVGSVGLVDVIGVWSIPDEVPNNWIDGEPSANAWIYAIEQSNNWIEDVPDAIALNSTGTQYTISLPVRDSSGVDYTVASSVKTSDGTEYYPNVWIDTIAQSNTWTVQ